MFDHAPFKAHPTRQILQQGFVNSLLTDLLTDGLSLLFFVGPLHREVGHDGLFPIFVDHVATNLWGDRSS